MARLGISCGILGRPRYNGRLMSCGENRVRGSQARRWRFAEGGFTLVELLVAVGIITVLVSLLMPALSNARGHARRVACLSNVRTLTTAWLAYAQNNRGRLCSAVPGPADRPGFHDWVASGPDEQALRDGVLWPYVNAAGAYRCPGDEVNASHTYLINSWLNGEGPPAPGEATPARILSRVRDATETFVFLEHLDPGGFNDRSFRVPPFPGSAWTDLPARGQHGRTGVVSFADGHAIVWTWLSPGDWHRTLPDPTSGQRLDLDLRQAQRWIGHGPYPTDSAATPD
jgi:prepilin-type N-terminal cleavage/methylation domain-containing protein/prepilin-type processing-associated H-X9-DG protein